MKKKLNASEVGVPVSETTSSSTTTKLKPLFNGSGKPVKKVSADPKPANGHNDHNNELDLRELLKILSDVRNGDFTVRMPVDKLGLGGKICDILNDIIQMNETLVDELTEARNTIGRQGHL